MPVFPNGTRACREPASVAAPPGDCRADASVRGARMRGVRAMPRWRLAQLEAAPGRALCS